jgi:hypothetical protein
MPIQLTVCDTAALDEALRFSYGNAPAPSIDS